MFNLEKGYSIKTKNFKMVTIKDKLGSAVYPVYLVDYDGREKILKWYSVKKFKNPQKFYDNLENIINKGKPSNRFLWPEDITEYDGEAFGYIIDRCPVGYQHFSKFLIGREGFASMTAMVNSALHITASFHDLHLKSYSNHDLNEDDFFINPKNGDILICDNHNVSEYGKNLGIAGKARYMAPEIVAKRAKPSIETDLFSLSVLLFLLWTNNHPLEGEVSLVPGMDMKIEKRIYGENPVFIFDPEDDSNRPVQGIHKGAIARWPLLPVYLQEEFVKAFSKELLTNPANRIIEQEWLRVFIRMRAEVFKCPCGEVYFADPVNPNPCPSCKKANAFPLYIKTKSSEQYNLPVHQQTKLYTCHTENDSDDFETLTGEVSAKGSDFELKNVSAKNWTVTDGDSSLSIAPNSAVALKKGMVINFGQASAEIR